MAELIYLPNGKCDLKFHANVKNFKRVENIKHKKHFYKVFIDKNDSVYEVKQCVVTSWAGKGKPAAVTEVRDAHLFNRIKGNPFKKALTKIIAEIDYME